MVNSINNQLTWECCLKESYIPSLLCPQRIGLPEMASDERYLTNALRVDNRKSMISAMTKRQVDLFVICSSNSQIQCSPT